MSRTSLNPRLMTSSPEEKALRLRCIDDLITLTTPFFEPAIRDRLIEREAQPLTLPAEALDGVASVLRFLDQPDLDPNTNARLSSEPEELPAASPEERAVILERLQKDAPPSDSGLAQTSREMVRLFVSSWINSLQQSAHRTSREVIVNEAMRAANPDLQLVWEKAVHASFSHLFTVAEIDEALCKMKVAHARNAVVPATMQEYLSSYGITAVAEPSPARHP